MKGQRPLEVKTAIGLIAVAFAMASGQLLVEAKWSGVVSYIMAAVTLAVAWSVFAAVCMGANWARWLYGAWTMAWMAIVVWSWRHTGSEPARMSRATMVQMALLIVAMALLFTRKAVSWFRSS